MRAMRLHSTLLVVAALAAGCADQVPTAPVSIGPDAGFAVTGQSECYTVLFNVRVSPSGPRQHTGPATGDLEGTVTIQFDDPPYHFAGITIHNTGSAEFEITDGVVGRPFEFSTRFDNLNQLIDRPGSPADQVENIGRHRASAGVTKANLTYHGTFSTGPVPQTDHDYRGVICM